MQFFIIGIVLFVKKMPQWMHHLGLERSFILGITLLPILLVAIPFTVGLYQVYFLRFIYGAVFGLFWLASETWVILKVTKRFRGIYISIYALLYSFGLSVGPLLLRLFSEIDIFAFALGIFFFIPLVILIFRVKKELLPKLKPLTKEEAKTSIKKFFWMLPLCFLATFICGFLEMSYVNLVLIYGVDKNLSYNFSLMMLSFFAAGNLIFQIPLGLLANSISADKLLKANTILALISAILWPFFLHIPWFSLSLILILGGTITGFYTIGLVLVGNHFKDEAITHANMVFILFCTSGAALGPFIVGPLMDMSTDLFAIALVLPLVAFLIAQYLPKMKLRSK